jgi:hypothetical protein
MDNKPMYQWFRNSQGGKRHLAIVTKHKAAKR